MQFRVIVLTDLQTNTQTGAITIRCAAASAQCKYAFNSRIKHIRNALLDTWKLATCSRFAKTGDIKRPVTQPSPGPWYDTRQCSL